jgi:hypothetical protein
MTDLFHSPRPEVGANMYGKLVQSKNYPNAEKFPNGRHQESERFLLARFRASGLWLTESVFCLHAKNRRN